ncbi:hypothetical protein FB45DRAFT_876081 [Roridomyces roridus]|uniref:Uncharacterized protein n=1 Tax=Roridomyces roridus TaxID=1738132 RepID=A0AAD7FBW7_9AGAR|nr:hypothetical protein FB45DRAFT_876081 [Roridomyces roridus]
MAICLQESSNFRVNTETGAHSVLSRISLVQIFRGSNPLRRVSEGVVDRVKSIYVICRPTPGQEENPDGRLDSQIKPLIIDWKLGCIVNPAIISPASPKMPNPYKGYGRGVGGPKGGRSPQKACTVSQVPQPRLLKLKSCPKPPAGFWPLYGLLRAPEAVGGLPPPTITAPLLLSQFNHT